MERRKDGRWQTRINIKGKRVYFYSSEQTKEKAEADINKKILAYEEEQHCERHNFLKLAEKTIEARNISAATSTTYQAALKHLAPLHDKDIEDIRPSEVQAILDGMNRKKYSFSAMSKTRVLFGLVMDYAIIDMDIRISNFAKSLKTPKNAVKNKIKSPDDEVIAEIKKMAANGIYGRNFESWAVSLYCTGMRRGELTALQRKDIDFSRKTISITKAAEFIGNNAVIKEPKTENGYRTIPIIDIYMPYLSKLCEGLKPNDYIFGGSSPYTLAVIKKGWVRFCKSIGHDFNMHQLRHAYAKLLYEAGIDPKTAQHLLGHADIQTTMNIYTDFSNRMNTSALGKLNSFLTPF